MTSRDADQQVDQLLVRRRRPTSSRRGHPAAHRLALASGRHQPQQQVAQQRPLLGSDAGVDRLGGLGDGAADPAGRRVARRRSACCPRVASRSPAARARAAAGRPGSPSTSRTSRSTRPGSISRPACRAGASMAVPQALARSSRRAGTGRARPGARTPGTPTPRPAGRRAWRRTSTPGSRPPDQAGEEGRRSAASSHSEKTSSHWSTSRTVRGRRTGQRGERLASGARPGVMTTTRSPSAPARPRRRPAPGTTCRIPTARPRPARPLRCRRSRQAATSSSRPKKASASSTS